VSSGVPFKTRVLLFLYGNKNLAGCVLALIGLGLFFGGLIEDWWLPIVAGLYATGWLAAPTNRRVEFALQDESQQEALCESLDDLIHKAHRRLPQEAMEILAGIRETVEVLRPRLFDGSLSIEQRATLTHAVLRDLPQTVSNYLRLPAAYANVHVVEQGKTCRQLLLDQLRILDTQMKKIADSIFRGDADALIVNGNVLREKFHAVHFLGDPPSGRQP